MFRLSKLYNVSIVNILYNKGVIFINLPVCIFKGGKYINILTFYKIIEGLID